MSYGDHLEQMENMGIWMQEDIERANLLELEHFLNGMDGKERRYMEIMAQRIPTDLSPEAYQQELNWTYRQVVEMINGENR
ncbi:hypothetical protein D081_0665 [Anaerovibrio sp. JC8]|uniref:hypothetical protein n=1 Tax=Anaerovibrio sp. JC8 TaxID=1240085 RepID=UPI000A0B25D1|nr:hypothetical protein [Anaerovibrio sp. JC8]ORU00683.1 hypothetical protein D081_0665 [Anaerovibrio sp. JC8]